MTLVLSHKATKLLKLCETEGFGDVDELLKKHATDSICPAICITEGCDFTTGMEPDQAEGDCEACGGSMISALVHTGFI
ncbi:hypothetical protein [uncultured Bradyrhizobium sp.]|uniref:hypothetical protein n=1 Tax=uncultured Bradyrhizobium sp. TaxID=199684 RepID=UPI0035CCA42A